MPSIALPTFLKILTKGSPQKVQEYGKYLKPGGWNFYQPLQEAAYAFTVGGDSYADCCKTLEDIPRETEQKYNLAGFKQLAKWIKKNKPTEYFNPSVALVSTPKKHLSVKLEPEFGFVLGDGQKLIVHLWYAKDTSLSKTAVRVGTRLISKHICSGPFSDCKAGILDLRRRELLAPAYDALAMDLIVDSEFAWIDQFYEASKAHLKKDVA